MTLGWWFAMIRPNCSSGVPKFTFVTSRRVRITTPLTMKIAGRAAGIILWSIFRTVRCEKYLGSPDSYGPNAKPVLYSLWHDSAVLGAFCGRQYRAVALTSKHRDGTFVEHILRAVNVASIRGSSGKTGGRAALGLLRKAETHNIVITPDGPRGPRRVMSRGVVYLASKTGNGIVPAGFACSSAWDVKGSWTSLTIPKPFSKVVALLDEPIYVPPDLDEVETNWFVDSVQQRMDKLQVLAKRQLSEPVDNPLHPLQANSASQVLDKAA